MHDVCAALYYQFLNDKKNNLRDDDLGTSPNASVEGIGSDIQELSGSEREVTRSRPTSPSADADEAKYYLRDRDMFGSFHMLSACHRCSRLASQATSV